MLHKTLEERTAARKRVNSPEEPVVITGNERAQQHKRKEQLLDTLASTGCAVCWHSGGRRREIDRGCGLPWLLPGCSTTVRLTSA